MITKMQAFKQAIDTRLMINPDFKDSGKVITNLTKFIDCRISLYEYKELIAYIETFKQGATK